MKLSELIAYRNQLALTNVGSITQIALGDLDKIQYMVNANKLALNLDNQQLQDQKVVIQQAFDDYGMLIDTLKQKVDQLINSLEHPYFVDSYTLYENDFENETAEDLADRHPKLSESTVEYLTARIRRYNSWKYPAMILRPGIETYVNDMVACDPLYLVDLKHELLEATITQYNQVYQQRLRAYVVDERVENIILNKLPDSQLGVILAYNYFNFRPFEVIKKWLTELLTKLKPGGVLLMTFNDCDNEKAVMLVEQNYCCYTPGHLIMQLAQTLGFEILHKWSDGGPSTWLELKRPGTIHSVRGGQALAKILPKPVAESK